MDKKNVKLTSMEKTPSSQQLYLHLMIIAMNAMLDMFFSELLEKNEENATTPLQTLPQLAEDLVGS